MLNHLFDISVFQSMVRMATPVMLAALGALFTGSAGIINIALEGMMLLGAFFAVVGSYYFSSVWAGLATALLSGMAISLLFGVFSLKFKGHIILLGTALNHLATALTVYLLRAIFNVAGAFSDPGIIGFKAVHIPIIKHVPVIGDLLSGYTPIVYITWLLVIASHVFLYKTPHGKHLRAAGENPEAASVMGINVKGIQYFSVILSGIFSSLAGAYLSLGQLTMFSEGMSANRGFMGLAANIFGMGTPIGAALASMLFGFADALAMRLQGLGVIRSQLILMLPSLLTIVILLYVAVQKRILVKRTKEKNLERVGLGKSSVQR